MMLGCIEGFPHMRRRQWPTGPRTIFRSQDVSPTTLADGRKEGRFVKVAAGIYTADTDSPLEQVVAENLWEIIAAFCPDAIIVDRTAARGGIAEGGLVTIATDERATQLDLPGTTVVVRPRVEHDTDTPWANGLRGSSPARAVVDNMADSRARGDRPARTLTTAELQDWLAAKRIAWGDRRFDQLEVDALQVAEDFGEKQERVQELFASVRGREQAPAVQGAFARAALGGQAWDEARATMFNRAADELRGMDVFALKPPGEDGELPFYEAYFSNYIEGTEFTIEEAREIVETQTPPARRSADGHDILGTHRCVVDPIGRAAVSDDPEELVRLLRTRHETLMVGRPDIGPGVFKDEPNRAGGTEFVDPGLVEGTLLEGLKMAVGVPEGLPRAIFMMVVIAEVHPFTDGNGRAARLMMNAELSAAGQCRIVVPTVVRNDYISALRRFSNNNGHVEALSKVLTASWRWTAAMPWHDRAAVDAQMVATNALMDAADAERAGKHLRLP